MTNDTTEFDDLVLTNPKLPPGWRPYHSDGTVTVAIEDLHVGARSWLELEQEWFATQ
jgi:hypothetical protein